MLVEWLREFAQRLLEQLHLKKKEKRGKSGPEPRKRPIQSRAQSGRQEKKHGYGHNW